MKKILIILIIIGIIIGVIKTYNRVEIKTETEYISGDTAEYVDELNIPLVDIDTLNPILTKNKDISDTLKLIYEPLFDYTQDNKIENKLASEYMFKDNNTLIIKLNPFVKWHDGNTLKAEDIIYTYNVIRDSEDSIYKEDIKNILEITKLDQSSVKIILNNTDLDIFSKLIFPIISSEHFKNEFPTEEKSQQLVGTGPYKFDFKTGDGKNIVLKGNENWWKNKEKKLKKINIYIYPSHGEAIKAFKSSEIDLLATTMMAWQKKIGVIGINQYPYESNKFETLIPNINDKILGESSVRKMILSAINSLNIVEEVFNGNGKISKLPIFDNSYYKYFNNDENYNLEKAKQFLLNAGWKFEKGNWIKNINGKKIILKIELLINKESEDKIKIANKISQNLNEMGIKVKIISLEYEEYMKRIEEGKFQLALGTLNISNDFDILDLIKSDSEKNYAKYKSEEIDKLIVNINEENKENNLKKVQNIYENELPYIGMFFYSNHLLTNKSVKGDIKPTSNNIYYNIESWCK